MSAWKHLLPLAVLLGAGLLTVNRIVAVCVPLGYALGSIIDPDLDELGITGSEARLMKTVVLAPLIGWTSLYAVLMKPLGGHRSVWSHTPVVGTFIRLCFMSFPFVVLLHYLQLPMSQAPQIFIGLLAGLSIADAVHWVLDFIVYRRS
jgi:uncharacterized metal-binding protein